MLEYAYLDLRFSADSKFVDILVKRFASAIQCIRPPAVSLPLIAVLFWRIMDDFKASTLEAVVARVADTGSQSKGVSRRRAAARVSRIDAIKSEPLRIASKSCLRLTTNLGDPPPVTDDELLALERYLWPYISAILAGTSKR